MTDTQRPAGTLLREVRAEDLQAFYAHQHDPQATAMAAHPSREEAAFLAHWQRILEHPAIVKRTIVCDSRVAGNIVCFEQGGQHQIGYWIGREFWGRNLASTALAAFLAEFRPRPLYAHVAKHNAASIRVLQKCGFVICGEAPGIALGEATPTDEWIMSLATASETTPDAAGGGHPG